MANWQSVLDLKDVWSKAEEDKITIQELAKEIAARLSQITPCKDEYVLEERDRLVDEFNCISEDESADTEMFDEMMDELYNWGDTSLDDKFNGKKVCWVRTF